MLKTSIIIIGGGFGGVACAQECARLFRYRSDIDLTLVSPRPYHDYHGALYEMATAIGENEHASAPHQAQQGDMGACLRKAVCMPLAEIFNGTKVRLVHGIVRTLDRKKRLISLPHVAPLSYHYTVLALGSASDTMDIPGIREEALGLKTIEDAITLRSAVVREWKKRSRQVVPADAGSLPPLRIIIGGGGFTGTELSAELAGMLRALAAGETHSGTRVPYEIILLAGRTGPVAQLGSTVSTLAHQRLEKYGVTVKTGCRIARVEKERFDDAEYFHPSKIVILENGERLKADVLVWTGGVIAAPLYYHLFPHYIGDNGRLTVEHTLQVIGEDRIFAVGDGAYLTTDSYPRGLPMQASIAVAQGIHAARNIAQHIKGAPLAAFQCPLFPFVVPLGGKYAIAQLPWSRVVAGFWAWTYKQWLEFKYYCTLLGMVKGIRLWWGMEKICLTND